MIFVIDRGGPLNERMLSFVKGSAFFVDGGCFFYDEGGDERGGCLRNKCQFTKEVPVYETDVTFQNMRRFTKQMSVFKTGCGLRN